MVLTWDAGRKARLYDTVSAEVGGTLPTQRTVQMTAAGANGDTWTLKGMSLRTLVVTAAGADDTTWTFTWGGRTATYLVAGSPSASAVAAALKTAIDAAFDGELLVYNTGATLVVYCVNGQTNVPTLVNSGAGTRTTADGFATAYVDASPSVNELATALAAAWDVLPGLAAAAATDTVTITLAPLANGQPALEVPALSLTTSGAGTHGAFTAIVGTEVVNQSVAYTGTRTLS